MIYILQRVPSGAITPSEMSKNAQQEDRASEHKVIGEALSALSRLVGTWRKGRHRR